MSPQVKHQDKHKLNAYLIPQHLTIFLGISHRGKYMQLRPIRTEADYKQVLEEIESLFDAAPDTAECDRLDILSTLAEAYERLHFPIEIPDPIESIEY